MIPKKFDPSAWLSHDKTQSPTQTTLRVVPPTLKSEARIEALVAEIESRGIDITASYTDWRDIGFALGADLGENGRHYFHRVSRFYPKYNPAECDKQFETCLKSSGKGISIATLFHLAKVAGIELPKPTLKPNPISIQQESVVADEIDNLTEPEKELPTLPDRCYKHLPSLLHRATEPFQEKHIKDSILLGAITTLSAALPFISGIYDGRLVHPNLYLFVLAPAASGKGNLLFCRSLVKPIHSTLMNASKIERQEFHQANADSNGKKQPNQDYTEPTMKMLFIPANISSTGFFQLLNDNDGRGLLFETEGDTLAYAFKQDYGNYSDGFRKAYQHEPITYYRKTNREYCELEKPKLSCVLSGTPEQIKTLTPSAENGLFSRFVFYFFKSSPKWKNVFEKRSGLYLEAQFEEFGNEFFRMYQSYETHANTTFSFTDKQHEDFQKFFTQRILYYDNIQDPAFIASVFRMGVVHFRIAMVLTALRYMEDGNLEEYVFCSEEDFYNALEIVETLFKHSNHVFDFLPKKVSGVIPKNLKEKFLETLPKKFTRKSYLDAAESLGINAKTADGYVCVWVKKQFVFRQMNGQYEKAL